MKDQIDRKNRAQMGFSLVEIVVVIAIMAILGVGVLAAVPSLTGHQVRRAVRTIDTMLSNTKTTVMAKGNGYFLLRQESDGSFTAVSADGTEKPLGSRKGIEVTYKCSDNVTHSVTASEPLIITFDKASGAFSERVTAVDPKGDQSVPFSDNLFRDWRYNADGTPNADFVLNNPAYSGCILVAGKNFGSGIPSESSVLISSTLFSAS